MPRFTMRRTISAAVIVPLLGLSTTVGTALRSDAAPVSTSVAPQTALTMPADAPDDAAPGSRNPSTSAFFDRNQRHYFTIDSRGALRHFWRDAKDVVRSDVWSTRKFSNSRPAAIVYNNRQIAYAVTTSNELVKATWSPGAPVRQEVISRGVVGTPAVMSYGSGANRQLHLFVRTTGNRLRHIWESNSGPRRADDWGSKIQGNPVAYVSDLQQHAFVRCDGGAVCHWWRGPGEPVRMDRWAGPGSAQSDVTGFVTPGQQHIFYRGAGQTLRHVSFDRGSRKLISGTWPGKISGTPVGHVYGSTQTVVAQAPSTGSVTVTQWNRGFNSYILRGSALAGVASPVNGERGLNVLGRDSSGYLSQWRLSAPSIRWSAVPVGT